VIAWSILLTVLIEGVTICLRFGAGLESSQETSTTIGRLTGGLRIHHGYLGGLAILIAAAALRRRPAPARWLLVVGIALVASDLVHHFFVLWPIVGSPQFELVYPQRTAGAMAPLERSAAWGRFATLPFAARFRGRFGNLPHVACCRSLATGNRIDERFGRRASQRLKDVRT